MAATWTYQFPYMPVIATEANYAAAANNADPSGLYSTDYQAAYLADTFTFMRDVGYANYDSQFRLVWYTRNDLPNRNLGLYDGGGGDTKSSIIGYCPGDPGLSQGSYTEPIIYGQMVYYSCY